MAFYHYSNYYQNHQQDHGEDNFSCNFSYDYASDRPFLTSYSNNPDNEFFENQSFGYDLHQPDDIENAVSYPSSYADFSSDQQLVTSYLAYSFNEDNQFFGVHGYNGHPPHHHEHRASYYSYTPIQPTVAYSASPLYESKTFKIDPHNPYETRFIISYSTMEFNEPEFEDYDPTPYGGGYDPSLTYGKPLPPSDEVCYPKDSGKDDAKVQPQGKIAAPEEITVPAPIEGTDRGEERSTGKQEEPKPLVPVPEVEKQGDQEYGTYNSPPEVNANGDDRMFPLPPPGLGLDALDICESLFGYWPCLARDARRGYCCCPHGYDYRGRCIQRINECEGAANYLFGSPDPYYGMTNEGRAYDREIGEFTSYSYSSSSSSSVYTQERQHYEDQGVQHRQAEYDQISWIDKLKI
ncbi:uncharacterized protein LOC116206007 [Punica granatum]|uniref:Uncharacterized protein n=2 Tax=Punica granatum TaxID=22663 RepID=A0A218XF55_PUNGR|nr:uncharacterized protein LOC116206007 [Punica granatum]OWM83544.1 hypothetical protein CDL15_Pgr013025 [Punica granatum]PKI67008.1 hypothetical protein CRG98_012546 [Punica granatum]